MNEAKEKWMPEIYCLGASTPYAYTWPDGRSETRTERLGPSKEKENFNGEGGMVKEEKKREREVEQKV